MFRIGDEVYVHGYIDEIRRDIIIIKNDGGFFGTAKQEVYEPYEVLEAIKRLESEYMTYRATLYPTGQDSDYWKGVRYALDMMGGKI